MSGQCRSRPSAVKPGFTLLELLVVVSIISLLLAILMPSLREAREQSKQLVCRNNLTNMWRGTLMYAVENRDRVPYMERISTAIDPFDPKYPTLIGNVLGQYVERGSFVCPAAVAGYPDKDPNSKRHWKLTYDFSTADRVGIAVPYDDAEGAFSGQWPDPSVVNDCHFDGRPLRTITVKRDTIDDQATTDQTAEQDGRDGKVEIIWTVSVPLIADRLKTEKRTDGEIGISRYPHRGIVRRHGEVFKSLASSSDPYLILRRRPGYFQLHADKDRCEVFLTRYSPDLEPVTKDK